MNADDSLIALMTLLIICLLLAAALNIRHQKQLQRKKTVAKMRQQAELAKQSALAISPYLDNPEIARTLIQYSLNILTTIATITPHDPLNDASIKITQQVLDELPEAENEAVVAPETATEIKHLQASAMEAINACQRMAQNGRLDAEQLNNFRKDLSWTCIKVEVMAYLSQGDKIFAKGDAYTAEKYYKQALNCLKRSAINDPRKTQYLKMTVSAIDNLNKPNKAASDTTTETGDPPET